MFHSVNLQFSTLWICVFHSVNLHLSTLWPQCDSQCDSQCDHNVKTPQFNIVEVHSVKHSVIHTVFHIVNECVLSSRVLFFMEPN